MQYFGSMPLRFATGVQSATASFGTRSAPDVQRVVRVEQLRALLARRDVDERPAGVQRHPAPRVVSCAPARAVQALQDRRRSAARPHHWDTSYTLPRTTSQQSPGVLCCATSFSEKPLPARTTGGSLRCDALLPSGGMLVWLYTVWRASRLASSVPARSLSERLLTKDFGKDFQSL
jgi:hypothetical protein